MKSIRYIKSAAAMMAVAVLFFSTSCTKETNDPTSSEQYQASQLQTPITDKRDQAHIDRALENVPGIAVYNSNSDQYILISLDENERKFDFSNPGGGISFSSPDGTVEFVQGPDGSYYQVVTPGSSGGGAGGVLSAGDVTLNVNYVLCFASGDADMGGDLFGLGEGFKGFSGAVGIAGDFEELMNGDIDDDFDPFDFIFGYVVFYVFDGSPDGDYEVLDFLDAEPGDDSLEGNALAYFISFQDGEISMFFGVDGAVNFNGNQVGFQGTYWGIVGFDFDFEGEDEPEYVEAAGSGFLTCQ